MKYLKLSVPKRIKTDAEKEIAPCALELELSGAPKNRENTHAHTHTHTLHRRATLGHLDEFQAFARVFHPPKTSRLDLSHKWDLSLAGLHTRN